PALPYFSNIVLNAKGDAVLKEGETSGIYISDSFGLPFAARIFMGEFKMSGTSDEKMSVDISLDGGKTYCSNCAEGRKYYSAKKDFSSGSELKLRIAVRSTENKEETAVCGVETAGAECLPGNILVISPNGGEEFGAGGKAAISWTALDYDEYYRMKIEYSPDGGSSYEMIADKIPNSGTYIWNIPTGFETGSFLIRVSDALDSAANDTSDGLFHIKAAEEPEEAKDPDKIETIGPDEFDLEKAIEEGERPGTKLYDLLIKVGDNVSLNQQEDAVASFKNGDIVIVRPSGHRWGAQEKRKFLIVKVYLTEEEVKDITQEKKIETGKFDRIGNPIMKTVGRRKNKVNLQKLGISGGSVSQAQDILNKKAFEPDVIEQK
ncbi:MAG: hypothetical protein PHO00_00765, partial [bacterium]|nr:hypothetical protein [bacterium]